MHENLKLYLFKGCLQQGCAWGTEAPPNMHHRILPSVKVVGVAGVIYDHWKLQRSILITLY